MSTETNPAEPGSLRNAGPWEHLDGTPCPYYVASRPRPSADEYWWCTEHQQHVRPAEPDAGVWNDEPTSAELDLIRLVLASDWLVEVRRIAAKETAERIEADALELVREWTQMDGRLVLSGRDLADFRDQLADVIAGRSS